MSEYDENFDNEEIVVILFMVMAREGEAVKKSVFFVLVVVRPKKSELRNPPSLFSSDGNFSSLKLARQIV